MLDAGLAQRLKHVEEACDVGADVSLRMLDGVADPGLRREMYHAVRRVVPEQSPHGVGVAEVAAHELERPVPLQTPQTGLLEGDVVVRVQVVEAEDGIAPVEQTLRCGGADEARGAGDEDPHALTWIPGGARRRRTAAVYRVGLRCAGRCGVRRA